MAKRATAEVDLEDFHESLNILVHAYPGTGKTRFGATAPNSVFLSAEPGVISAARGRDKNGIQSVVKARNWSDALDFLRAAENGDYSHRDWVVVDTVSTLQEKNMKWVVAESIKKKPGQDPDIPEIQNYMKSQNSFMRWWEGMIDLPMNVLFLAHTMRVDDNEGDILVMPSLMGGEKKGWKVANYCMGLVNAVGFMDRRGSSKDPVIRTLWQPWYDSENSVRYVAKDHFAALGRSSDNLSMPEVIARIMGSVEKDEVPAPKTARRRAAKSNEESE